MNNYYNIIIPSLTSHQYILSIYSIYFYRYIYLSLYIYIYVVSISIYLSLSLYLSIYIHAHMILNIGYRTTSSMFCRFSAGYRSPPPRRAAGRGLPGRHATLPRRGDWVAAALAAGGHESVAWGGPGGGWMGGPLGGWMGLGSFGLGLGWK